MSTVCLVCNKDDRIQRVSTILQSGRSSGTYSGPSGGVTYSKGAGWGTVGGFTTLSGSSTTDLAKLLAAPVEPSRAPLPGVLMIMGAGMALVGAYVFVASLGQGAAVWTQGLGMLVGGGGALWVGFQMWDVDDHLYKIKRDKWDIAITKWSRLYFCHRDGEVFDPETNRTCEPGQLNALLYS